MTYKFRAECAWDVTELLRETKIKYEKITIIPSQRFPDVEVEIESESMNHQDMIDCLKCVIDGHVMWQTVQPISEYTGVRDY
jgi:hypothetical protein